MLATGGNPSLHQLTDIAQSALGLLQSSQLEQLCVDLETCPEQFLQFLTRGQGGFPHCCNNFNEIKLYIMATMLAGYFDKDRIQSLFQLVLGACLQTACQHLLLQFIEP
ncbi:hypothetical protein D1872_300700 [compost metagenome]